MDTKIQNYFDQKKELYDSLLQFLEGNKFEDDFCNLQDIVAKQGIVKEKEEFTHFLYLLLHLYDNHHRTAVFIHKIEQILLNYKDYISKTYSNTEIYNIFKSNNLIILFLLENQFIFIDQSIFDSGTIDCHFFFPQIKNFLSKENYQVIENELLAYDPNIFDNFNEKQKEGENETYICSLIRQDLVRELDYYLNRENISEEINVKRSIFETNSFLIENSLTLIEYAAFFGSIKIFNYLHSKNVKTSLILWLCAIHSNNAKMIHLLEEYKVKLPEDFHELCLEEAIKCHHNNIAQYIKNNFIEISEEEEEQELDQNIASSSFRYYNYSFFPIDYSESYLFFFYDHYKYSKIVNIYLENKKNEFSNFEKKEITIDMI